MKKDIKSLTLPLLREELAALGQPGFRAGQVFSWLHRKRARSFAEMTDLPQALRARLEEAYEIPCLQIERRLCSKLDGTVKYLFRLPDGERVEAVRMHYRHGDSLCISTQAGCRMGCTFCASALTDLARDLTPAEMLDEVYLAAGDAEAQGEKVSSLVLMGIGEPLDNYDNVLAFLRMLSAPEGFGLGMRHVSLSTCGLVDKIDALAKENLQLTLSVSLHAPNDEIRRRTMPVARRWPIEELLRACRDYFQKTGRRVSFEYALIDGVNDSPACARELAERLRGMGAHVNLIPVNTVKESGYRRGKRESVRAFQEILTAQGLNATVRRELGADIEAACGQLRRKAMIDMDEEKT